MNEKQRPDKVGCMTVLCDVTNGLMSKYKNLIDSIDDDEDLECLFYELKGLEHTLVALDYLNKNYRKGIK